jgi:hypothetical protein
MPREARRNDRIHIPNVDFMRQGAWRAVFAGTIVFLLVGGFTVGGISMVAAGEMPGLPFAVGGLVLQLSVIVMLSAVFRVRSSLDGDTVSRRAMTGAGNMHTGLGILLLCTLIGLALYSMVRFLLIEDPWTALTTLIIGVPLALTQVATGLLRRGLKTRLAGGDPLIYRPLAAPGYGPYHQDPQA